MPRAAQGWPDCHSARASRAVTSASGAARHRRLKILHGRAGPAGRQQELAHQRQRMASRRPVRQRLVHGGGRAVSPLGLLNPAPAGLEVPPEHLDAGMDARTVGGPLAGLRGVGLGRLDVAGGQPAPCRAEEVGRAGVLRRRELPVHGPVREGGLRGGDEPVGGELVPARTGAPLAGEDVPFLQLVERGVGHALGVVQALVDQAPATALGHERPGEPGPQLPLIDAVFEGDGAQSPSEVLAQLSVDEAVGPAWSRRVEGGGRTGRVGQRRRHDLEMGRLDLTGDEGHRVARPIGGVADAQIVDERLGRAGSERPPGLARRLAQGGHGRGPVQRADGDPGHAGAGGQQVLVRGEVRAVAGPQHHEQAQIGLAGHRGAEELDHLTPPRLRSRAVRREQDLELVDREQHRPASRPGAGDLGVGPQQLGRRELGRVPGREAAGEPGRDQLGDEQVPGVDRLHRRGHRGRGQPCRRQQPGLVVHRAGNGAGTQQ